MAPIDRYTCLLNDGEGLIMFLLAPAGIGGKGKVKVSICCG